jgi:hypothetical protein
MEKQTNQLEMTEERKGNKIHLFLKKMDYRIGVFSLLFLVLGFIGGSHTGKGHHKVFGGHKFNREHCMEAGRSHSFHGDKGGKEHEHPHYKSRRHDLKKDGRPDDEKLGEEKNSDEPVKEKKVQ